MRNNFNHLGIIPPILKALEEMEFKATTEVQSKAIPHILNQKDLIVRSKTGSGKTAAFGVPILQLTDPKAAGPQVLILTPTRELAVQVGNDLKHISKYLQHNITSVYGQHSLNVEIQALNKEVSIVVGTPGRVHDHIRRGSMVTKHIRFLVLDEADRMLDMGFLEQVAKIIRALPKNRVTLLFSATMPAEIHKICREYMKNPITVEIESQTKTVDTIHQVYYRVDNNEKNLWLHRLLLVEQPDSCIIFCNTRMTVDRVQSFLSHKGYACHALHGDIPQGQRLKTIQKFKQGEFHLLVATDVAARGIHIDDLSMVINYDVPNEKDSYIHRVGRTGRAGNRGRAITLATGEDIMSLYEIEEHIHALIPETELPSEDIYNERRVGAEKWIKANSQKVISRRTDSKTNFKVTKDKHSHEKLPHTHKKHSSQPTKINTDRKTIKTVNSAHPAKQAESIHSTTNCMPPHSKAANMDHSKQNTQIRHGQEPTTKKSFFQRIVQRIFGK